jgi:predicted transposase YbfD/YdcC
LATLFPPELIKALRGATPSAHEHAPPPDLIHSTRTVEKGHGRIETRRLVVSRECAAHLNWPGAAQLCRIERTRERAGTTSHEIAYAITSLSPEQADPDTLLALWRDHWLIENRLHWRRDVVLREDHSTIRSGTSPRAVAALRNTMLAIVHDSAEPLTEIREIFAENRLKAIAAAQQGFL